MSTGPVGEVVCVDVVELLTDYIEGTLDDATRAAVDEHLADCAACRLYLEQLRETIQALGHVPAESLSPTARQTLMDAFRGLSR